MRTVFTNGCFDCLHVGHIRLLQFARQFGSRLIVGLNSDDSIKRIKGITRPIVNQDDRTFMLQALSCVDEVVIFNEDTPHRLINDLQPAVIVKGPDYKDKEVIGGEDRQVIILDCDKSLSTTQLISNRIEIAGKPILYPARDSIEIRFVQEEKSYSPYLFRSGKRVTEDFIIQLNHIQGKDKHGRSA